MAYDPDLSISELQKKEKPVNGEIGAPIGGPGKVDTVVVLFIRCSFV